MKFHVLALSALLFQAAEAKTIAYWPMTKTTVDEVDKVRCAVSSQNDLYVNADSVTFENNDLGWNLPPNPDMTATAASLGGHLVNQMMVSEEVLKVGVLTNGSASLSSALSLGQDFTVEGWCKFKTLPARSGTKNTNQMFLYMTLAEVGGWAWNLWRPMNSDTFQMNVRLTLDNGRGGTYASNLYLADGLTEGDLKDVWHHYALSYRRATATWSFYLDGELKDTAVATDAEFEDVPVQFCDPKVHFFGCQSGTSQSVRGDFACWRVSDKALTASELLYGTGTGTVVPEATSKTLAYWKLDRNSDGSVDGKDSVGVYDLTSHAKAAQETGVALLNPDGSVGFKGDSAQNVGSVQIADAQTDTDKCLFTADEDLLDAFKSDEGWTLEGYVKRTALHANFGTLFGLCNAVACGNNSIVFSLRAVGNADNKVGYTLYDKSTFGNVTTENKILTGLGYLPSDEWTHVAIEVSYPTVTNVVQVQYDLFVNGNKEATLQVVRKATTGTIKGFVIGGDTGSQRTFAGWVDSFRLSKGALDPSEFLCATPSATPTPVSNLSYWPLDNADGAARGDVSVGYQGYAFIKTTGVVYGSDARARGKVAEKSGLPAKNVGSVAVLSDGSFAASNLGSDLNLGASWSVEGYQKLDAGTAVLCGTYDAVPGRGWKLILDRSGASPAFKLYAAAGSDPFVDAAFASAGNFLENDWNHILLTHDANGTWTLSVNGVIAGTLTSAPRTVAATSGVTDFYIGGGSFDLWRATMGILPLADSLYALRNGLLLIFR